MHFSSIKPRAARPTKAAPLPLPKPGPRAISIVELIIAMTIFLVIITTGLVLVSQVSKAAKKVEMQEYLSTEGQALLERIAREIQTNAIDYEEYYSHYVIEATANPYIYGTNYGEYHKQFFHPGYTPPTPPPGTAGPDGGYGAWCTNESPFDPDNPNPTCTPLTSTFDFETGAHPYTGPPENDNANANAFCNSGSCSSTLSFHEANELYLINKAGDRKLILALENYSSDPTINALSFIQMDGNDDNGDGITDSWDCSTPCTQTVGQNNLPSSNDLTNDNNSDDDFIPYSPSSLAIQWIKFYISPIEDPFKGYNEIGTVFESVQQQPRVTIVMNAKYQLYDNAGDPVDFSRTADYIGAPPEITFQTTVGTGVSQEIPAYAFP